MDPAERDPMGQLQTETVNHTPSLTNPDLLLWSSPTPVMGLPLCKTTGIWDASRVARIQSLLSHNHKKNCAPSALTAEKYTAYPGETCFPYSIKVLMARNTKPLSMWHRKHSRQHHTWWCVCPTAPQASWVLRKNLKKHQLYFCFTVRRRQKRQNCMGLSRFEHWLPTPACPA